MTGDREKKPLACPLRQSEMDEKVSKSWHAILKIYWAGEPFKFCDPLLTILDAVSPTGSYGVVQRCATWCDVAHYLSFFEQLLPLSSANVNNDPRLFRGDWPSLCDRCPGSSLTKIEKKEDDETRVSVRQHRT